MPLASNARRARPQPAAVVEPALRRPLSSRVAALVALAEASATASRAPAPAPAATKPAARPLWAPKAPPLQRPSSQPPGRLTPKRARSSGAAASPAGVSKRARDEAPGSRVTVAVRVRPPSSAEALQPVACAACDATTVSLHESHAEGGRGRSRRFAFDAAFGPASCQGDVYDAVAAPLVAAVAAGETNATCICYGATGAGKTHTMLGTACSPGLMPRALAHLFRLVARSPGATVRLAYLEVYQETVRDLLAAADGAAGAVDLREDPAQGGVSASGLSYVAAPSADAVVGLLRRGNACRRTEATRCNATSSRSHAVLRVLVTPPPPPGAAAGGSGGDAAGRAPSAGTTLSLVDLAGSERALATDGRGGARSAEGACINKSLLALSSCIHALVERCHHVPFRNSKLTLLLKDSLGGGGCRTALVACVAPTAAGAGESANTLHWADRAKQIRTAQAAAAARAPAAAAAGARRAPAAAADRPGGAPRCGHAPAPPPGWLEPAAAEALRSEVAELRARLGAALLANQGGGGGGNGGGAEEGAEDGGGAEGRRRPRARRRPQPAEAGCGGCDDDCAARPPRRCASAPAGPRRPLLPRLRAAERGGEADGEGDACEFVLAGVSGAAAEGCCPLLGAAGDGGDEAGEEEGAPQPGAAADGAAADAAEAAESPPPPPPPPASPPSRASPGRENEVGEPAPPPLSGVKLAILRLEAAAGGGGGSGAPARPAAAPPRGLRH